MPKSTWTVQRTQRLLGWSGDDSSANWSAPARSTVSHGVRGSRSAVGLLGLLVVDIFTSFAWACGMHLAYVASGGRPGYRGTIYIAGRFLFGWLSDLTGGGSRNPLTALTSAAGRRYGMIATILFRVPAQVAGATVGIQMFAKAFPGYKIGPFLEVDMFLGAAVQGILAFTMAVVNLNPTGLAFFHQTFISTMTRMVLNQLSSGLTNGWLNPATAFGWAYHNGNHMTEEHIFVYWIAPLMATLIGVRLHDSFSMQERVSRDRWKSD